MHDPSSNGAFFALGVSAEGQHIRGPSTVDANFTLRQKECRVTQSDYNTSTGAKYMNLPSQEGHAWVTALGYYADGAFKQLLVPTGEV